MPVSVPVAENATLPNSTAHLRDIRTTTLPNGLLVLTERMPHLRFDAMGVWVNCGSRDEAGIMKQLGAQVPSSAQ